MEKYILKTDEATVNVLAALIENEVLPVVASLAEKLTALGIASDAKQRITELFAGNYGPVEAEYRARLEKDAALFQSASAKEGVLAQLHEVMADLKGFVTEELGGISNRDVGGLRLTDTAILDYLEFKKGVPVITEDHKAAIMERYTTYVQTEAAAEIHKKHSAAVTALNELIQSCEKAGVQFFLPVQFFGRFFRYTDDGFIAAEIDYDDLIGNVAPAEDIAEETESAIRHRLTTEQKPIIVGGNGKMKHISTDVKQ